MTDQIPVFPPIPGRRNGDPAAGMPSDDAALYLMRLVHEKVEKLEKNLQQHMGEETVKLAEEIATLMNKAFPGGDPEKHRLEHEARMKVLIAREEFWRKMGFELARWGLIGVLVFFLTSGWKFFLEGPK
jgi:hypothetical protein